MVLLVVDTQKAITNSGLYQFNLLEARIKKLINTARNNEIEVIFIRHDDGVVDSSFMGTGLLEYLREKEENTIIVVGLYTDYCIDATIKAGFEHGFKMIVPENTNSTFDNQYMTAEQTYRYYNEFMWNGRYAEYIPFDKALELMTR